MKRAMKILVTVLLLLVAVPALAGFAASLSLNGLGRFDALRAEAMKSGWADGVRSEIRGEFESMNRVSDIPSSVTDLFLTEAFTDEVCAYLWKDGGEAFPRDALTADLTERITSYAAGARERGEIALTDEEWQAAEKGFAETAAYYVDAAREEMTVRGVGSFLRSLTDRWAKLFPFLVTGCALLAAGALALLGLIFKKQVLPYLYGAFAGAGLTLFVPGLWLKLQDYAARLQIYPSYLKAFLVRVYGIGCGRLWIPGAVLLILGLSLGVWALFRARNTQNQTEKQQGESK